MPLQERVDEFRRMGIPVGLSAEQRISWYQLFCGRADKLVEDLMVEITRLTDTVEALLSDEWRDVGTLPKIDPDTCQSKHVLGCWSDGFMMVVYLDVCSGWRDAESGELCVTMPTHWQPLPDPPVVHKGGI